MLVCRLVQCFSCLRGLIPHLFLLQKGYSIVKSGCGACVFNVHVKGQHIISDMHRHSLYKATLLRCMCLSEHRQIILWQDTPLSFNVCMSEWYYYVRGNVEILIQCFIHGVLSLLSLCPSLSILVLHGCPLLTSLTRDRASGLHPKQISSSVYWSVWAA